METSVTLPAPSRAALVELRNAPLSLSLAPSIGGAIAAFSHQATDGRQVQLMRAMSPATLQAGDVLGAGCFPLTPFSNRLRDGKCRFGDTDIHLKLNSDGPHTEHGHGWQRPWLVEAQGADHATLLYRHQPDDWPFAYEMRQHFQLTADRLDVILESRNTGRQAMPYGFGLHPYFARTPRCRLTAPVQGFWTVDAEVMPTALGAVPAEADLTAGVTVAEVELDNAFTGWSGEASIDWPEHELRLTMQASAPLRFLVVYVPKGEDHFCAEPVSNCTDAFNLAASRDDTGMVVLKPGETIRTNVSFTLTTLR